MQSLQLKFIDPSAVRPIEDANIVCLSPCEKLEDSLQYHDELLMKGRTSEIHKSVHDEIGVSGCESDA